MPPTQTRRINVITKFITNARGFSKVMAAPMDRFKKMTTQGGKLSRRFKGMNNDGARFGHRLRRLTHGMRGFRMEMLGVMFFGMGVQKFFTGLLKPALQLTGFMELLSTTLGLVFLPIVLSLLDVLLPVFLWLMNSWAD